MRTSSPSILFLTTCGALLPACSDTGIKATNSGPEAAITSHADGDVVAEGASSPCAARPATRTTRATPSS